MDSVAFGCLEKNGSSSSGRGNELLILLTVSVIDKNFDPTNAT
jgi:hypothetical protein